MRVKAAEWNTLAPWASTDQIITSRLNPVEVLLLMNAGNPMRLSYTAILLVNDYRFLAGIAESLWT